MHDNKIKDVDNASMDEPEHQEPGRPGRHGPHGKHEGIPPYILKEIMELKEKVGKLEGMLEVMLKKM